MTTYEWITTMLVPITSLITWLAASRKRRNDTLGEMQRTARNVLECAMNFLENE